MSNRIKILCVDDDEINRDILNEILVESYCLEFAETGKEALEKVNTFQPDIILLDIMMPGMDGYEVCRRVREKKESSLIKILLISGKAMDEERLMGYRFGADDYIIKPFVDDELAAKVAVFSRLKRSEEVDRIREEVLALFSHETRTPLNQVLGGIDLLQDENLPQEARQTLSDMKQAAERLFEMSRKTTLLCSIKSGELFHFRNGDLGKAVSRNLSSLPGEFRKRLEYLEAEPCSVFADWEKLSLAIGWLLEYIANDSAESSRLQADLLAEGKQAKLSLRWKSENGEADNLHELLKEFSIRDMVHHHKGDGLSLAVAKQVLKGHGGDLTLHRCKEENHQLCLYLPLQSS